MAPKEQYKVHSLSKHIEDTKKGLSADAQYNRRPVMRAVKQEAGAIKHSLFGTNDDSDDDTSDSDSSSDSSSDEGGSDFLRKLAPPAGNATAAASKRRSKGDEIADSDVERNASAKQALPAEKSVPINHGPESSDGSTSDIDSDDGETDSRTNRAPINKAPSTISSSSSDSESDDESDSDSASAAKPAAANKSPVASDSGTSDSESDEESDEEGDPKVKTKPAVNGNATSSTSSSEESDSEESNDGDGKAAEPAQKDDGESSSASDFEESGSKNADESIHIEDRMHGGQVALPNFISPDFVLRKGDDGANGQDVARICSQANMQGKQFWYFTVPSNVPISVVQNVEIPMDQALRSERVFSHAGEDYGVFFDSMVPRSSIEILIPSADSTQYHKAPRRLDQVMHVRRITQLGADGADSATVGPSEKRAPRAQPKGLKARYQPIGVNAPMGKIGMDTGSDDEDTEMAEAPVLPATANASPDMTSKKDKKRKQKGVAVEASKERKGKRKHSVSEDEAAAAAAEQLIEESQTAQSKTKKQKTGRNGSPVLGSEPQSSSAAAKKQTPVVPPTIPNPSTSFSSFGSTPVAASTPAGGKAKKAKKAKGETAVPSSSQSLPALRQTPVPVPRQTVVPIPPILSSAQLPKVSPVPVPQPVAAPSARKREKKTKKREDEKAAASSSQQSPPPSAQASRKGDKKVTPVPPPAVKASG
ncbi:Uncharacterized protein TCAP_01124 [Tolypocladium capitatum]|uniref:DNA-directed RNA polymerase I subunit n=1 Tax=Tolypocladium capitatum TaxID=45235 RepID=A0A2K3QN43_9HYPO|nr:Uncharacterized protein TCAP_01124 [Tolypocladium capitatum]